MSRNRIYFDVEFKNLGFGKPLTKLFIKFLLKHSAYIGYIVNFSDATFNHYSGVPLSVRGGFVNAKTIIDRSFLWSSTKEGDDFWDELDNQWAICFNKHRQKCK